MVILRAYLNFPIKPCYTVNGIKLCIFCLCDLKISHQYYLSDYFLLTA